MEKLTDKQASVLGYMQHFKRVNDFMPTYKEIQMGLKFKSPNAAVDHCKLIEKKGYIRITPNIARGIVLL